MLRILIIEDSKVVSLLLKSIFELQADMQVIGIANNGLEGVRMALSMKPDLIAMDIRMPVMDGFEATRRIMSEAPTPIVVISSHVDDEELDITFRAIEAGALMVMEKPCALTHPDFENCRRDLVDTVRAMSQVKLFKKNKPQKTHSSFYKSTAWQSAHAYEILAIGCSTGGPQVLKEILSVLPKNFPVPIVITQHIANGFIGGMVSWLSHNTPLRVKQATQGEILKAGTIYFAPDSYHLTILRTVIGLATNLTDEAPLNGFRPSIDAMFKSVALSCVNRAVGALLTGMGVDGADGMLALKNQGSHTVAQDEESAVVYGMPSAAITLGAVDQVVELSAMSAYLSSLVGHSVQ